MGRRCAAVALEWEWGFSPVCCSRHACRDQRVCTIPKSCPAGRGGDLPPGLDSAKDHQGDSLGESEKEDDSEQSDSDDERQERNDERSVLREGQRNMREQAAGNQDDLGEGKEAPKQEGFTGKFPQNIYVDADKQTLRVGAAWGMPGLYSSDGANRDMIIGTAGGKKVFFGTARNDAWIQASTGHMWLKGSITVKNYGHFFAEKQRLRVGAVWGMPGLYSSDGKNRDMVIGTAAGNKIYFGVKREDAWIQAGKGAMWLKGGLTVKSYGHFFAEGQRLRVGAVWGMPGLYASDGDNRDMIIGTAAGKKIYFGIKKKDAWIEAGSGNMFLKGKIDVNLNSHFKAAGKTLRVGSAYGMPCLYASDGGADDLILGTTSGRRVFFGDGKKDAWVQAGTGHMWIKGSLTSESDAFVISQKQKLRVGSVWGMPGLYASDGQARDLMLGTEKGRKIYFGKHKTDAWIQSGTGDAWFAGNLQIKKNLKIDADGVSLRVGQYAGLPGLYSSDTSPKDLIVGVAKDKKVHLGAAVGEAYFTAGAGSLWLKGSLETHDNVFVYSENQRLRVGSVNGIPGIYSSDGVARDLMLGTAKNSKVYFGDQRADAWIQAGTGESYFKGTMTVGNAVMVQSKGQTLKIGEAFGMPGIYSSEGTARDLMLGAASGKKVYLGMGRDNAWVESGTGDAWFKGKLSGGEVVATGSMTVKKQAFFDDTVTVKKNLILSTAAQETMDVAEELSAMRTENTELRAMMSEMRSQMAELMSR